MNWLTFPALGGFAVAAVALNSYGMSAASLVLGLSAAAVIVGGTYLTKQGQDKDAADLRRLNILGAWLLILNGLGAMYVVAVEDQALSSLAQAGAKWT